MFSLQKLITLGFFLYLEKKRRSSAHCERKKRDRITISNFFERERLALTRERKTRLENSGERNAIPGEGGKEIRFDIEKKKKKKKKKKTSSASPSGGRRRDTGAHLGMEDEPRPLYLLLRGD